MGSTSVHAPGSSLAARLHRAQDRRARADEIVVDHDMAAIDRANEQVATDDAAAATFLVQREADVTLRMDGQQILAKRCARFCTAEIRADGDGRAAILLESVREVAGHQRCGLELVDGAAKRVLERREVVRIQRKDVVGADCLEQLRRRSAA